MEYFVIHGIKKYIKNNYIIFHQILQVHECLVAFYDGGMNYQGVQVLKIQVIQKHFHNSILV